MDVWNGIDRYPGDDRGVAATLGNYDGVHLGHRTILEGLIARARRERLRSLLITFEPHPLTVVAPERRPWLLQTAEQRLDVLSETGIDGVLIVEFTPEIAVLDGRGFFEMISGRMPLRAVHVGAGFRFGKGRTGDAELLRRIGRDLGFDVVEVPPVAVGGAVVSSSEIRERVRAGDVGAAREMLGRAYAIRGTVVRGDRRGTRLHYPTANLETANEIVPRPGVYVTESTWADLRLPSVTNVGVRPTFGESALTVESHVLDFEGDLYDRSLEVSFLARLRDEIKFRGPEELSAQIGRDLEAARAFFATGAQGRPDARRPEGV